MHYVYLLKNERNKIYYGCTGDLRKRFFEHNHDKSFATKKHRWRLIYYEAYSNEEDAWERERQLKLHGQAFAQLRRRLKKSLSAS